MTRSGARRVLRRQRCQRVQRLWKALHRDDPEALRILARDTRVRSGGHEEDIHTGFARADRLLLDGADREHRTVELELAGGGDLVTAVSVVTELFHQAEGECKAGGGAADARRVDADPDRELADEGARLVDEDPDRGGAPVLETADRPYRRSRGPASPAKRDTQPVARAMGRDQLVEATEAVDRLPVDGDEFVAWAQHLGGGRIAEDASDQHARQPDSDVVPQPCENDGRRRPLRLLHLGDGGVLLLPLGRAAANLPDRNQRRVAGEWPAEEVFEQMGFAEADVDEVDAALVHRRVLTGNAHERLKGVSAVRQEDVVVVRGNDVEDGQRDRGQSDSRADRPRERQPSHLS